MTTISNPWLHVTTDPAQIKDRVRDLKIIRFWLEQNIAMIDACIATMGMQEQAMAFNPFQFWMDAFKTM